MNYIKITKNDIANGPGVRVVLWVAGCSHHCRGCHNPETWNPRAGQEFTESTMRELIEALSPSYVRGLTLSGGDPLYKGHRDEMRAVVQYVKSVYPDKDIWCYTGYTYEEISNEPILRDIDVLVDGKFIEEQKDISLKFRGSRNQRILYLDKMRRERDGLDSSEP